MDLTEFTKLPPDEQIIAYHRMHGGECYRDGNTHFLYYADGAVVEDGGAFQFPPDPEAGVKEEYKLYWRKRLFAQLKLARAVAEFDQQNTFLAHHRPVDEEEELVKLKALQQKVEEAKKLLAEAEAALDNTEAGKMLAKQRNQREEEAARVDSWSHRRSAFRI